MLKLLTLIFFTFLATIFFYFIGPKSFIPTASSATTCPAAPTLPQLQNWWKLNEGLGTSITASKGGISGTLTNAIPTSAWQFPPVCKAGQCLKFDGIDDYVNLGNVPNTAGVNKLTIAYWVNPSNFSPNNQTHISRWATGIGTQPGNVWGIRSANTDEIRVDIATGAGGIGENFTTSNLDLVAGKWSYLTIVYDGSAVSSANRVKVYKDGVLVNGSATASIPTALNSITTEAVTIAERLNSNQQYFNGLIDDVQLFNDALKATDVSTQYKNALPKAEGLITAGSTDPNPITNFYNGQESCIIGSGAKVDLDQATIIKKLDTFEGLKNQFYDKAQASLKVAVAPPNAFIGPKVYYVNGNLTISYAGCFQPATGMVLVFVNGNLRIQAGISPGGTGCGASSTLSQTAGIVFVVKGKIDIVWDSSGSPQSNRIDGVLIAEGKDPTGGDLPYSICTALDPSDSRDFSGDCGSGRITTTNNPLEVHGSLISLNPKSPIKFRRDLNNNTNPAELVDAQPKYLPLLKDIMSRYLIIPFEGP